MRTEANVCHVNNNNTLKTKEKTMKLKMNEHFEKVIKKLEKIREETQDQKENWEPLSDAIEMTRREIKNNENTLRMIERILNRIANKAYNGSKIHAWLEIKKILEIGSTDLEWYLKELELD